MKLEAGLTRVGRDSDGGRPGSGGGSGGLLPGEVAGSVVSLAQWTPPPMMEGVLVWWQPVLVLNSRVPVCRQHLHTRTGWRHVNWPAKVSKVSDESIK